MNATPQEGLAHSSRQPTRSARRRVRSRPRSRAWRARSRAKLGERYPLVLAVMGGSVMFAGQLLPQLRFPLDFDYLDVTRYGAATVGGEIDVESEPRRQRSRAASCWCWTTSSTRATRSPRSARSCSSGRRSVLRAVLAEKDIGPRKADHGGFRRRDACPTATSSAAAWTSRRLAQPAGDLRAEGTSDARDHRRQRPDAARQPRSQRGARSCARPTASRPARSRSAASAARRWCSSRATATATRSRRTR